MLFELKNIFSIIFSRESTKHDLNGHKNQNNFFTGSYVLLEKIHQYVLFSKKTVGH